MMSIHSPAQFLIAILAFIVAVGILVAVHEFGHFWVARKVGIKVLRFSIGFGKPWWKRVAGPDQVEYVLATIPLGGYVKLLDEREGPVAPDQVHRAFNRQPVWKRIATLLAGPAFNLLFAILLYWILFMIGVQGVKPVVGAVLPNTPAAQAGLRFEDEIIAVDSNAVATQEATILALIDAVLDHNQIALKVRGANGDQRELHLPVGADRQALTMPDALLPGLGFDFDPQFRPIVGEVPAGQAAERAGVKVGDTILSIAGQQVTTFGQISRIVEARADQDINLTVSRNGETLDLPVKIGSRKRDDGRTTGFLGVGNDKNALIGTRDPKSMVAVERYGPFRALVAGAEKTWSTSIFTVKILGKIVTGDVSVKNISGPISIAEVTGFAARQGIEASLTILALISISLGVLNLLPVPILDGGQIVYQLAELVKGKPVSERALILGQQLGIALLILLMGLAFYNDVARHLN
jgi:regulator of sigma E protease